MVYAIDGVVPVVDETAFVHPLACLIGDVIVGPGCYVGPYASLRGDMGRITLGEGANVQDNCVAHTLPNADCVIGPRGHIGHGAVLHGCTIGDNAMVGMNAVVMDGVEVGEAAIIAAMAFVKAGFVVPPRVLAAGVPAKVIRALDDSEVAWKSHGTAIYGQLAQRCRQGLVAADPLPAVEPDRRRVRWEHFDPIFEARRKASEDGAAGTSKKQGNQP